MDYTTIRQYAAAAKISYEAARKSVRRYQEELGVHVFKRDGLTVLDEDAVNFLNEHRQSTDIVEPAQAESITRLRQDNAILNQKVAQLALELLAVNKARYEIEDMQRRAEIAEQQAGDLKGELEKKNAELEEVQKRADVIKMELEKTVADRDNMLQAKDEELKQAADDLESAHAAADDLRRTVSDQGDQIQAKDEELKRQADELDTVSNMGFFEWLRWRKNRGK